MEFTLEEQLKALSQIRIDQIQAFDHIARLVLRSTDPMAHTEQWKSHVCNAMGLDYSLWPYYNELSNFMVSGMPPCLVMLQIACTTFVGADVRETIARFSSVDAETALNAMEFGNKWRADNQRIIYTMKAIDDLLVLYSSLVSDEDAEADESRCIGYPGMPNMHPYLNMIFQLIADHNMVIDDRWRTPAEWFNQPKRDFALMYPPNLSEQHNAIIKTEVGTIYLTKAPKRGDTNSNHLRSV
ncbi:hypothetical protein pEaSNUABM25_00033 [Erwinia phage pEa_SNUABM_25]|nr:hypothetical protein pEaSNUABM25_00033 [Erwinia phage pEa_SNUABM_25]